MNDRKDKLTPRMLTVVLADRHRTVSAIVNENEHVPYGRRTVQIELTPEQREAIAPRCLFPGGRSPVHEHILDCWLEPTDE